MWNSVHLSKRSLNCSLTLRYHLESPLETYSLRDASLEHAARPQDALFDVARLFERSEALCAHDVHALIQKAVMMYEHYD